jgi:hypothetical protein
VPAPRLANACSVTVPELFLAGASSHFFLSVIVGSMLLQSCVVLSPVKFVSVSGLSYCLIYLVYYG